MHSAAEVTTARYRLGSQAAFNHLRLASARAPTINTSTRYQPVSGLSVAPFTRPDMRMMFEASPGEKLL